MTDPTPRPRLKRYDTFVFKFRSATEVCLSCDVADLEAERDALKAENERLKGEVQALKNRCPEGCTLTACWSGDGWVLSADKDGESVCLLEWSDVWKKEMNSDELEKLGFEVV